MTKSNGPPATASNLASALPPPASSVARCEHADAAGRRCTMPRADGHPTFCARHARQELRNAERAAARSSGSAPASQLEPPASSMNFAPQLLGPVKDFQTAAAINHVLGRLFILHAGNRIPARTAGVLAYICQLMLQSLPEVKDERQNVLDHKYRASELFKVLDSLPNLRPSLGSSKPNSRKP